MDNVFNCVDYMKQKAPSHLMPRKELSPSIERLVEKLSPYVEFKSYNDGQRLPFQVHGIRKCYLIGSGAVTLHQQPDDMLLGMFEAPAIRGIVHASGPYTFSYLTLRVSAPSQIAVVNYDDFMTLIARHELWNELVNHLQAVTSALFRHTLQVTLPSAYEIICHQLLELMHEPQRLREKMTAEKYIRSKTRLSRSGIMRILSELKAGGYIVIEDGILEGINNLPPKF